MRTLLIIVSKALQALSGSVRVSVFDFGSGTKKVGFLNPRHVSGFCSGSAHH